MNNDVDDGLYDRDVPPHDLSMVHPSGRVGRVWFFLIPSNVMRLIRGIPEMEQHAMLDPHSLEMTVGLVQRLSNGQRDVSETRDVLLYQLAPGSVLWLHRALEWLAERVDDNPDLIQHVVDAGHLCEVAVQGYSSMLCRLAECDDEDDEDD